MSRKIPGGLPDAKEWDFRSVAGAERPWCVLWEYARSSPANWVETAVSEWFGKRLSNGKLVSELVGQGRRFSLPRRELFREAEDLLPTTLRPHKQFLELIQRLPDFPKPWLSIDPDRRKKHLEELQDVESVRRNPWPSIWEPTTAPDWAQHEMLSLLPDPHLNALLNQLRKEHVAQIRRPPSLYILAIDWGKYRYEDALVGFKNWLKSESNRQRKKRTGRLGPSNDELLRYLVAWRFKKAGLKFVEAQKELTKLSGTLEGKCLCLPITSDKARWSKDIAAARRNANAFFPKPEGGGK